jgi:CheY-like chemotaxis protein/GGDEF domain-containing protein
MGKPIVLCVDDEKIILDSLESELSKSIGDDYIIELAESGEEAIEIVEEIIEDGNHLALVISDYIMPGMKGDEVLIKIHEMLPDTLKVMLTGQADANAVGNVINKAKLYQYISKPWERDDLILTVQNALQQFEHYRNLLTAMEDKKDAQKKIIDTRKKLFEAHNQKLKEQQLSMGDMQKELERVMGEKHSILEKYEQVFEENKQLKLKAVAFKKKLDEINATCSFESHIKREIAKTNDFHKPITLVTFGIDNYELIAKKLDNKKEEMHLLTLVRQYIEELIAKYHFFQKTDSGKFQLLLVETPAPKAREIIDGLSQQLNVKIGRYKESIITFSFGMSTYENADMSHLEELDDLLKSFKDKSETAYVQAKSEGRGSISEIR